jgi:N-acetylneuraminic acid mutarotase
LNAPQARQGHCLSFDATSNKIYLFGGSVSLPQQYFSTSVSDLFTYDPTSLTWTLLNAGSTNPYGPSTANQVSSRYNHACAVHPSTGVLYVHGGTKGSSRFSDVWRYNNTANNWQSVDPGNRIVSLMSHKMMFDKDGSNLYLIMGNGNSGDSRTIYQYNMTLGGWNYVIAQTNVANRAEIPARDSFVGGLNATTNEYFIFGGQEMSILLLSSP